MFAGYKNYRQISSSKTAIVFTPTVNIKSSPDYSSSTLFVIHSGTKIEIIEKIENWYQIKIANGNKGWLQEIDFKKI